MGRNKQQQRQQEREQGVAETTPTTSTSTTPAAKEPTAAEMRRVAALLPDGEAKNALLAQAAAKAPAREAKPKAAPRPTCSATKKDGQPCAAKCVATSDLWCHDHQPAWDRLNETEQVAVTALVAELTPEAFVQHIGWFAAKKLVG